MTFVAISVYSLNVKTKEGDLLVDYSKNKVNKEILGHLFDLVSL